LLGVSALGSAPSHGDVFAPKELIIEAFIDGPSSFHLRREGFYWRNGNASKPGKWGGRDEPTFINGKAWKPRWRKSKKGGGPDSTEMERMAFGTIDVEFELLAVTKEKGDSGMETRTPVGTKRDGNEFVVTIPDPEPEARWYTFVLRKRDK
jgi:hypothetical protein